MKFLLLHNICDNNTIVRIVYEPTLPISSWHSPFDVYANIIDKMFVYTINKWLTAENNNNGPTQMNAKFVPSAEFN